jgi:hypothetical protein
MISLLLPCFTLTCDHCPCNYGNYSSIFSFHIQQNVRIKSAEHNLGEYVFKRTKLGPPASSYEIWQNVLAIKVPIE